jgi:hypothetical protein
LNIEAKAGGVKKSKAKLIPSATIPRREYKIGDAHFRSAGKSLRYIGNMTDEILA